MASLMQLAPIFLIFAVFYVLTMRPENERQRRHQDMVRSLAKDDAVVTVGGIHAVVSSVAETTVELEIAKGVRVVFDKTAIARKKESKSAA
jgi:preprotein translocase subunit YajC